MVDSRVEKLENELRVRIKRLIADDSRWCLPRYKALQKIRESEPYAFLCGGAVRDILLSNKRNRIVPRDLDIILGYVEVEKVADSFSDFVRRWNCYGGVSIQIRDWSIDMWSLKKTWAFVKQLVEGKGLSDFPKTTFLDIEAVAVQLFTKKGRKRNIYSKGFFESILKKTIEINLEDNTNPAMCIVRSLNTATKFRFAIGPKLAKYIADYTSKIELEELHKMYRIRYRDTRLSIEELYLYIKAIKEHLRVSGRQPVNLPNSKSKEYLQAELWNNLFQQVTMPVCHRIRT